jgi:uncharacterized cofD-like protein
VDDVRSSLLALSNDTPTTNIMKSLFAYQFNQQAEHGGHNFGNLFMSALTEITGSTDLALQAAARMLNIQGQVLPMTLTPCPLVAHLSNGTTVTVDTPADLMSVSAASGLRYISLAQRVPALDTALQAIQDADIIVFGPTDFYFNLMAPMQLEGFAEALAASRAIKVFVCNILTQPNTTDNWPASRYIGVVLDALGGPRSLDYAIINSTSFALNALTIKAAQGHFPVQLDLEACLSLGVNVIVRPVASAESLHHDPEKLVRTILFLGGSRSARRPDKRNVFPAEHLSPTHAVG